MTIAALGRQIGRALPQPTPPDELGVDLLATVAAESVGLVKSIKDGTVTVEQIDSLLQQIGKQKFEPFPDTKKQDAQEYLLCTKATLLFSQGQEEEGLAHYDQALKTKETPSTWALKGTALLQLERLDEAFAAFRQSYSLREAFGTQKQAYLSDLIGTWSTVALLRGLSGILEEDVREAEKGVLEYIDLLEQAKEDDLAHLVLNLAPEEPVPEEIKDALNELDLMVSLLSIKDPFERWREFTKQISMVWPEGVSAVDAIREQRE